VRAAAVEQLDVLGLGDPARRGWPRLQAVQQRVQLGQAAEGSAPPRHAQRGAAAREVGAQFGVGVAQQVGQHAQRA
jgi:hypothetical protein